MNFDLLPASEQAKYRRDASIARSVAKARLSPLNAALAPREEVRGGPLDIATLNAPFPLQPSAVSEHQSGRSFASVVKHWVQQNSAKQLPQESFPDTVPSVHICNEGGVAKPICIRTLASKNLWRNLLLRIFSTTSDWCCCTLGGQVLTLKTQRCCCTLCQLRRRCFTWWATPSI